MGNNSDEINVNELENPLEINDWTLNDKSSIGRMNDKYPIKLLQIKNSIKEFKNNHKYLSLFGTERVTSHEEKEYIGEYRDHFIGWSETIDLEFYKDLYSNLSKSKIDNDRCTHCNFINKKGKKFNIYTIPFKKKK